MPTYVSQSELARKLGVSRQYIHKLIKNGLLKLDRRKQLNLEQSIKAIKNAVKPTYIDINNLKDDNNSTVSKSKSKATKTSKITNTSKTENQFKEYEQLSFTEQLRKAQAVKETFNAKMKQIEYEELIGKVVNIEIASHIIKKKLAERDLIIRRLLLSLPTRCATNWDNPKERPILKEILENEVNDILIELSEININLKNLKR